MSSQLKKLCLITGSIALSFSVNAKIENLPSSQSFTGSLLTPNAQVIDYGSASFLYGKGVPYQNKMAELDNLFFAASFAPGIEAGGRIVTKTYDDNLFTTSDGGIRDLSASLKYQIPYVYDWTGINLAIGGQDIGGAANNFEAYYIVADYEFDALPVRVSAGYGKSKMTLGILDGPFASLEIQPLPFAQIVAEYDATEVNAAAKLFTPDGLLPYGAQVALQYQLYNGHEENTPNKDHQNLWSLNASVPLLNYNFTETDVYADNASLSDKVTVEQNKSSSASLKQLENALIEEGFVNIRLGKTPSKLVIALENRRYNQNQVDGIGVALGIISSNLGQDIFDELNINSDEQQFELYALSNDTPIVKISASAVCYRDFIKNNKPCENLSFSSLKLTSTLKATEWLDDVKEKGFGRSQLILSPAVRHRTATEYGVFDYSLALASNLYTPLWQGAAIDIRHFTPVENSDDFDDGGFWEDDRFESEVDRVLVHQAVRFPFDVTSQVSAGIIYKDYKGLMNETQWSSPTGMHTVSVQVSDFAYKDEFDQYGNTIENKSTQLAAYTLNLAKYNWQGKIQAGTFWQQDSGFKVSSVHWLGDVKLKAEYLSTKADGADEKEEFVSLSVSLPLTFWRDMKPRYLQVRGTDQFTHSVQTRVGKSHNNLNTGLGGSIDLQHSLARQYYNDDRISTSYFEEKQSRLRNAYLRYLEL